MESSVFWEITPLKVKRRFERICRLRLQGRRVKQSFARCLLHAGFFLGVLFNPEDGGYMFLWNFG
jgi:hypothetical protein